MINAFKKAGRINVKVTKAEMPDYSYRGEVAGMNYITVRITGIIQQ
jgi:hypothetical protein